MRTLVAIPVYNEEAHLPRVLDAVRRYTDHILVIDDGSTDRTAELLKHYPTISVIHNLENRGYGQSLIHAFRFAACRRFSWVVTMDCDEQHEPRMLPAFFTAIAADDADIISGSRYLTAHPEDDDPPPERRRINQEITDLLREKLRLRLTDSFCGFKAHRVSAVNGLPLNEPGYAFPLQFWTQCVRAGLRIRELPVPRIYRDRSRRFGGTLDDPDARRQHYLEVLAAELNAQPAASPARLPLAETTCRINESSRMIVCSRRPSTWES